MTLLFVIMFVLLAWLFWEVGTMQQNMEILYEMLKENLNGRSDERI